MNSLYGRFGMSDYFDEVLILGEKEYLKFEALSNKKSIKILDVNNIGNKFLIKYARENIKNYLNNFSRATQNINIAIASTITSIISSLESICLSLKIILFLNYFILIQIVLILIKLYLMI